LLYFATALSEYEKITLDKDATYSDLINKASILRKLERYDESLSSLEQALLKSPKKGKTWVHHALGHHFDDVGNHDLALSHWSQSIALSPKEVSHYLCRAETQLNLNNYGAAMADSAKVLKLNPKSKSSKLIQAKILFMQGEYSQCRNIIEKHLIEKPRSISTQLLYIAVLYAIGENYNTEAQVVGRLLTKETENEVENRLSNLSKLLERVQSKRSHSNVINTISDNMSRVNIVDM
jgi:tetratricopeptide (TPR) repeat protein